MNTSSRAIDNAAASRPPPARYTRTAILLHWLIAIGIIANVALALSADSLPDSWARPVIDTHKSIGITVLGLALLRVLWRLTHRPPALPTPMQRWERRLAHAVHFLLYLLIFAMPISGWLHDSAWDGAATHPMTLFGVVPWFRLGFIVHLPLATKNHLHDLFGAVHTAFAYVLYAVFALHLLGALKHELIDRQSVLRRMLP